MIRLWPNIFRPFRTADIDCGGVEPWTANYFQVTGNNAFGGNWNEAPDDNAVSETAIAQMTDIIAVIGACTNGGSIVEEYQAQTQAGFKDFDYNS